MAFDPKDYIEKKKKDGIHVSISVDIRKVENFFKKLFGKKDSKEDKDNGRRKKNRRRNS